MCATETAVKHKLYRCVVYYTSVCNYVGFALCHRENIYLSVYRLCDVCTLTICSLPNLKYFLLLQKQSTCLVAGMGILISRTCGHTMCHPMNGPASPKTQRRMFVPLYLPLTHAANIIKCK